LLPSIVLAGGMTSLDAKLPPPADYYQIAKTDAALFSVVISLAAVSQINSGIDGVIETDPPEDRPLRIVGEVAIEMIKAADRHSLVFLPASEIESFEGSLFVHWTIRNKRVTLIASGPDGHIKLYKKGEGNLSELVPNPSAKDLSVALYWIMQ
jgi:hypothetical protein